MRPVVRALATLLVPLVLLGGSPVVAARVDTTPPVIDSLVCTPTTLYVGDSVSCTVTARDDETGVAGLTWTFGDGGTGTGVTVTHTYEQPGLRVVDVTAVDGAGNSTRSSMLLDIFSFQVPPPGAYYSEPTLDRLRLHPARISARGLTRGVPRGTRMSLRLTDLWDTTRVRVELRRQGGGTIRIVWSDVDEGAWSARIGTAPGARHHVDLAPGRYVVAVRAINRFGSSVDTSRLRVVR